MGFVVGLGFGSILVELDRQHAGSESPSPTPAVSVSTPGSPAESPTEDAAPTASAALPSATPIPIWLATRMKIPDIGVDAAVEQTGIVLDQHGNWVWEIPRGAVGHLVTTANPGERGNGVYTGHVDQGIFHGIFHDLARLHAGSEIILLAGSRAFTYRTESIRVVAPTDLSPLDASRDDRITLITCWPPGIYSQRLVVTAIRAASSG
jgi:LPXTG-site transpeptidase (sortase) family protein